MYEEDRKEDQGMVLNSKISTVDRASKLVNGVSVITMVSQYIIRHRTGKL
jgi:hypothetical protein